MKSLLLILCLASVAIGFTGSSPLPQRAPEARRALPDPHRHGRAFTSDMTAELAPEIRIVEASIPTSGERENVTPNRGGTLRAFTISSAEGSEQIFVENLRTGTVYEIQGVPFPNRPLSDAVWVRNYLIFDRSTNPRFSTHYVFDMNRRALALAHVFSD